MPQEPSAETTSGRETAAAKPAMDAAGALRLVEREKPRAVLVAGPTASGKSALALAIARAAGGVVINADSMQVYAEMRVVTARPDDADEAAAPHRLYGHIAASEPYSVARWLGEVATEIEEAKAAGHLPIIVGGTGLYFKTLTEGLSPIPSIPPDIRARWRQAGNEAPAGELHALLAARDPETAARLRPSDTQRIVRALEVFDATGQPLAHWQRVPGVPVLPERDAVRLVAEVDRDELYARADARFARMVELGALDEVRQLMSLGLDPNLPAMRALGVAPLARHLSGECDLATAIGDAQRDTRNYVKRQTTWLRRYMISWTIVCA